MPRLRSPGRTGLEFALALSAAATGCRSVTSVPLLFSVSTTAAVYGPGDWVSARISNLSDEVLGFTVCQADFDRYDGSRWTATRLSPDLPCQSYMDWLNPMTSRVIIVQLGAGARSGVYRLRLPQVYSAGDVVLPEAQRCSNPFRVP